MRGVSLGGIVSPARICRSRRLLVGTSAVTTSVVKPASRARAIRSLRSAGSRGG